MQAKQLKLKRARLADDLNEKIAQRPGPMELVEKNILPVESSLKEAIIGKARGGSVLRAFPTVAVISYQFFCLSKRVQSYGWSCDSETRKQAFSPKDSEKQNSLQPDGAMKTLNYREYGCPRIT